MITEVPNPPFEERWHSICALITAIRDYQIPVAGGTHRLSLIPTVAGCSFGLAGAIGSVAGTSGTLPLSSVSNDMDVTRLLTQFEITSGFCEPEVADALAAHGFFQFGDAKGPSEPLESIFGIGITGTIASKDPTAGARGGHRVYISLKTSEGTTSVGLKFQHGSELGIEDQNALRRYQSQLADLAALNLVAAKIGIPQVPFRNEDLVRLIVGTTCPVNHGWTFEPYDPPPVGIETVETKYFIDASGKLQPISDLIPGKHVLLPTSANPLTPGHDAMAREVKKLKVPGRGPLSPVFAITAYNADKQKVDGAEVLARARRFVGRWPVLLITCDKLQFFVNMAAQFKLDFAVGGDTPPRIFQHKHCVQFGGAQGAYADLKAHGVKFYVFPRKDKHGRMSDVTNIPKFARDPDLFVPVPHFLNAWSSTQARTATQGS